MAILALVVLVLSIVIGTKKKINIGIVGIAGACILSLVAKVNVKQLVSGFDATLFLRLLGIQLLVCCAQTNGTMEALANKMVALCGKRNVKFIPIVLYISMLALNLSGGNVVFLATPFVVALALQLGQDPIKVLFSLILAFQGSALSPMATIGINTYSNAEKNGIFVNSLNCVSITIICSFILFVVWYFIFGWYKEENKNIEGIKTVKFTKNHILTLIGFAAYIVMTLYFKMDAMIAPTIVGFILLLIGAADPKATVKSIPWNVLIMIGGVTMLTGMMKLLGGVQLLTNLVTAVSVPFLEAPLMVLVAGLMGFFTSGNAVVIPTLIPITAGLSSSATSLVTAIGAGANATAVSPFSVIGGHMMSCYDSIYKPTEEERAKTFNNLILFAIAALVSNAVLAAVGIFSLRLFG